MKKTVLVLLTILSILLSSCNDKKTTKVYNEIKDETAAALYHNMVGTWSGTATDSFGVIVDVIAIFSSGYRGYIVVEAGECEGTTYHMEDYSNEAGRLLSNLTGFSSKDCSFRNGNKRTFGSIFFNIDGDTMTGEYTTERDSGTIDLTYNPLAEKRTYLPDFVGIWGYGRGRLAIDGFGGRPRVEIEIDEAGYFEGEGLCKYAGQIDIPDLEWSMFHIDIETWDCEDSYFDGLFTGVGVMKFDIVGAGLGSFKYDPEDDILFIVGNSHDRGFFDVFYRRDDI